MKVLGKILKFLVAVAAIAGAVYVAVTYGDRIVAWVKEKLGLDCCCECSCECCDCEEDCCEAPAEEATAEEIVSAEETDFEG